MNEENKYKHGFKTPPNYFEDLDDRIMDSLELDKLPKETGFAVPDGYFDQVDDRILEKLSEKDTTKVIPLFKRRSFIYAASIAASIALILTFSLETETSPDELELTDIEIYLDEAAEEMSSYELAQYIPEEDLEDLNLGTNLFSEENLENYLLQTIDDTTLLIE